MLKVANGAIVALSLLANNVGAGKANVLQTPALARSVASVPLQVVIAAGISAYKC